MSETKAARRALCEVVPPALALVLATVWLLLFAFPIAATPLKLSSTPTRPGSCAHDRCPCA
jgi:hypothetical protein